LVEDPLHPHGAAQRALRVVLVRDRRTEDHEDGVADEFLDRPVVPEGLLGEVLEDPRDEHLQLFGIEIVGERGESDEVGEQDGNETALLLLHTSKYRGRCSWARAKVTKATKEEGAHWAPSFVSARVRFVRRYRKESPFERRRSAPPIAMRVTPSSASGVASFEVFVDGRFWTPAPAADDAVRDPPRVVVWVAAPVCGGVCTPATAAEPVVVPAGVVPVVV